MANWILAIAMAVVLAAMWLTIYGIIFLQWVWEHPFMAAGIVAVIAMALYWLKGRKSKKPFDTLMCI